MAKRRTQEQKERARQKRAQTTLAAPGSLVSQPASIASAASNASSSKRITLPMSNQQPRQASIEDILHTDAALVKKDLLKTAVIAVLLLIGIFGIFIYLR